ncbi:hypothetical protein CONLIGDRAFT_344302 [Coniochaeta ligniaria NRRL 30616]|uniref:Uncharacterized protein n=1 Tax=Coniochaeta ligniaria NRRL 30616 TaxID=1408157 RepID=A0A1J7JKG8_9PEZI|nr:hypothetical protein CONLIGDRAFT_344302 [Coniochaeta ligniaria NRRL 30616]
MVVGMASSLLCGRQRKWILGISELYATWCIRIRRQDRRVKPATTHSHRLDISGGVGIENGSPPAFCTPSDACRGIGISPPLLKASVSGLGYLMPIQGPAAVCHTSEASPSRDVGSCRSPTGQGLNVHWSSNHRYVRLCRGTRPPYRITGRALVVDMQNPSASRRRQHHHHYAAPVLRSSKVAIIP